MKTYTIVENERDNIKVYGAILHDLDSKFGFKREFKTYKYLNSCSSKFGYFNYYIDIEEGQIFEVGFKGMYKNGKYYFILKNGEFKKINATEIIAFFKDKKEIVLDKV